MTTACRNHILTAFGTQSSPQHALRGWLAPGFSRRSDETARQPCLCSSQHDLILGSSSSTPLDVIMFFLLPTSHLHLVVSFSVSSLYYPCLFFPRIISSLSVVWCSCLLLNCFFFFFFTPFCVLCALAFRVVLFQACFLCASFVFFFFADFRKIEVSTNDLAKRHNDIPFLHEISEMQMDACRISTVTIRSALRR